MATQSKTQTHEDWKMPMMCRPLNHMHAHTAVTGLTTHVQPSGKTNVTMSKWVYWCQISVTQTYFLTHKINENVNGWLPLEAEAWNTVAWIASGGGRWQRVERPSPWSSHWFSVSHSQCHLDSSRSNFSKSNRKINVAQVTPRKKHTWPSSNVWLGRATSAVLQKPALS